MSGMDGAPSARRGRARGRIMTDPSNVHQLLLASTSAASGVGVGTASVVSQEPRVTTFADLETASIASGTSTVCENGLFEDAASSVASSTSRPTGSLRNVAGSVAGSSKVRELDNISGSAASDNSGKGLRVTIRDGFVEQGKGGEEFGVLTNYLHMNKTPHFQLHQYRVDFSPEEDSTFLKKLLVRSQESIIGCYIFDGHMMYTTKPIPMEKRELVAVSKEGTTKFTILIKSVGYVLPSSPMYLQFYNMVMRKCMTLIGMEELGRHFYNRHTGIKFVEDRLELWPGIVTAIRNHESGILLCIEVTHKVLRMTTVYDMIQNLRTQTKSQREFEQAVKKQLIGIIVITHYNRRTYKADDVDFNVTPAASFRQQDGTLTCYADYYRQKYNITMEDMAQPALVSIPKKKDLNKGITGNIYLFPTICNPTGLTDVMRKNFTLMKKLSDHLHMGPNQRKQKLDEFVEKIKSTPDVQREFAQWDIDFVPDYVMAVARKYPSEKVYMGPVGSEPTLGDTRNAEWTRQLKGRGMLTPRDFSHWIIFVPSREGSFVDMLIDQLKMAARAINFNVTSPMDVVKYTDARRLSGTIRQELSRRESVKFAFVILQSNNVTTYADVKKTCVLDFGIGCQCFLAKNMNKSVPKSKLKLGSICTKVMIQITSKLGGVPWGVTIPVKKLMVLGFDVYHCSERKGQSAGALVSTRDQSLNQYFSTVTFHKDKSELAKNLAAGMLKSLSAFRMENKEALPDRIILFRDGVGEGQINYVLDVEVPMLQAGINECYKTADQPKPKLSVVIVTKKINSRVLLAKTGNPVVYDNVPPGTVVDNTITLPERYDYFLVSQSVNQGIVSPTNYNVVYDESEWAPERMQKLSFKLCHLYYNWCGTVAVPAPCQYAHKLAYLTGIALNEEAPMQLANNLWYL